MNSVLRSAKADMYRKHAELMRNYAEDYFDVPQIDVVNMVPPDAVRILEVGCGRGATLLALKQRRESEGKPCEVVGIDIAEDALQTARERLDAAFLMDAEEEEFTAYPPGYFDVIIIVYVLEHVVNPWAFLRRWARYLRLGGHLIIGVPNISYYKFLSRLVLHDDFAHEPMGVLDWTHLRYFTLRSLERILTASGLQIDIIPEFQMRGKKGLLCKLFPVLKRFFIFSYIVRACKEEERDLEDYLPFETLYTMDQNSLTVRDQPK